MSITLVEEVNKTIQKLRRGVEPISDNELRDSIKFLESTVQFLGLLGERYWFAWRELFFDLEKLKQFREARKENPAI